MLSEIESDLSDNECDEDKGTGAGSENSATGDIGEDKRVHMGQLKILVPEDSCQR